MVKCILGERDKGHWASRLVLRREVKQGIVQAVCMCAVLQEWWEGEQGYGEGKKNEWMRNDEGDEGQRAISCKEGPTGIWGGWNICVFPKVILGFLDTLIVPPFYSPDTHSPILSHFLPSLLILCPAHYPFSKPSPPSLYLSISGPNMVQSLSVGLLARFPSGSSINSWLLTRTQPNLGIGNQVLFS